MNIQQSIEQTLNDVFEPVFIQVDNDSHYHKGPDSSSHFKVTIASSAFEDLTLIKRHRMVYQAIPEIMQRIHALQLHTYATSEWDSQQKVPDSSRCRGG